MCYIFTWRCYYKWWKSLSPTLKIIENMSFGLDTGLGFRHVWIRPTYPINNNILLFYYWVNVCAQQSSLKQCFSFKLRIVSLSFFMKRFFQRKLSQWDFCSFILCQRERKRHWVVRRARPWVLLLCAVWWFYPRRQMSTSLKALQWKCGIRIFSISLWNGEGPVHGGDLFENY